MGEAKSPRTTHMESASCRACSSSSASHTEEPGAGSASRHSIESYVRHTPLALRSQAKRRSWIPMLHLAHGVPSAMVRGPGDCAQPAARAKVSARANSLLMTSSTHDLEEDLLERRSL